MDFPIQEVSCKWYHRICELLCWLLSLSIRSCDFKWDVKVRNGVVGKVTLEPGLEGGGTEPCGYLGGRASMLKELPLQKAP